MNLRILNASSNRKKLRLAFAISTALAGTMLMGAANAATPADTLVIAMAIDDVISLDPAESFEITTSEILANSYGRLLRTDYKDPSKLVADIAERQLYTKLGAKAFSEVKISVSSSLAKIFSSTLSLVRPNWLRMKTGL